MGKKALVIGLGISGKSSAEFLVKQGFSVCAIDQKPLDKENKELLRLESLGVMLSEEKNIFLLDEFSLIVPSPGVSSKHPFIQEALKKEIEVVGEAELAFRHMNQRAVAITGTNGKTTVTLLVEHILRFSGKKAKALGNVGIPLTSYFLSPDPEEIIVAELSSYQLETMNTPVFDAAVILNITPDHLDRYNSMYEYAEAKARVQFCLKDSKELYLYDSIMQEYSTLFPFSFKTFEEKEAFSFLGVGKGDMNKHDALNAFAAWTLCFKMGVSKETFLRGLQSFKKPSHRIEFVKQIGGVGYYDDSKGTNIDAVISAVESMEGSVFLIAGGVDKGSSYMPWVEAFQGKVKHLFLLGEAALKIQRELGLFFNVQIVDSLENAVRAASALALPGDSVLLSPGCSSFDMFRDYAERGCEFQRCVRLLEE